MPVPRSRPTPEPIFPRLPGGSGAPPPARVAAHQRARLMGAMVQAVDRSGYRALTIRELVGLAGVSRTSFYEHFTGKEECFVATLEEIAGQGAERVQAQSREAEGLTAALEAGLHAFVEVLVAEPVAARLALVDSLSLGPAGVAGREAAAARFEALLIASAASAGRPLGGRRARSIVAGWRHAAYRAVRAGRPERLAGEVPDLVAWALACCGADEMPVPSLPASVRRKEPGWSGPVRAAATRPARDHRPRLLQATAQIAAEQGADALSIPAIAKRARTSNVAFYKHFGSTEEAFLAAFDELWDRARDAAMSAFAGQSDWSRGIAAALAALLHFVAREPIFARLAFFELPAAGPDGLDRADAALDIVDGLLRPSSFGAPEPDQSAATRTAGVGAVWAAIQHELACDRAGSLIRLAPRLAGLALAPFKD